MIPRDIVLLSTADWDNPFWTNKQHMAAELARRGFRILYVESLGLRRPTLKTRDIRRMTRRLWASIHPPTLVNENLWVWSPLALPAHGQPIARALNRWSLGIGLRIWLKRLQLKPDILWTYSPLTTEVFDLSRFRTIVYHCVDEIKAVPGMPREIIEKAESELTRRSDVVFVTAPKLAETRCTLNRNTHYLPNVADYGHFSSARSVNIQVPDDLLQIAEPRIGFIGAISSFKLDFSLIAQIARAHPEWSIVLIGQVGEGDPRTDVSELRCLRNIHFLGPRPYSQLPAYMKGIRIGMLPSLMNDYTASMFPMKFFEYLAAGLPVVSVALPALRDYGDIVTLARTPQDFIVALERELDSIDTSLEIRLARAQQNTYSARTDAMLEIIERTT